MKKIVILIAAIAFLSFSCNKYCKCDYYVDGKLQKNNKKEFVNVPNKDNEIKDCKDYSEPLKEIEGITYETKCK
jgi:hypothetical protein